ncbi:MAG: hypothetical protein ACLGP3_10375 [Acidobacteriota bacterium]
MDAMRWARLFLLAVLGASLALGIPIPGIGLPQSAFARQLGGKRLILKDGSYQIVAKYQIIGNRVRFLSAERDDWEEIPYSLVDWPATNKWNQEHQLGAKTAPSASENAGEREAAAIDRQVAAARLQEKQEQPTVAPGLQLPNLNGVWVLDNFRDIPELVELHQSAGDVNQGGRHNVLLAAIASFRGADTPIRINGQASRVHLHVNDPQIYVSLTNPKENVEVESAMVVNIHHRPAPGHSKDRHRKHRRRKPRHHKQQPPKSTNFSSPNSHYVIVRVQVVPGERVIGALRLRRVGVPAESEDIIPTKDVVLPGAFWMKIVPQRPLTVGEYALMEIPSPGKVNLDVWDFAVSPSSPENRNPISPIQPTQ